MLVLNMVNEGFNGISFYKYLINNGYYFNKEVIENFLLSLKVKPFEILTGNSGTGKTKLSQLFAQYVNGNAKSNETEQLTADSNDSCYHFIKVSTGGRSWGFKKKTNESGHPCGWSISADYFADVFPLNTILGNYNIEIDGLTTNADIEFVPQLYYDKNNKKLINYFKCLYENELVEIEEDKNNGVNHKKQLVDLGIDCNDLISIFSKDFIQKDTITLEMKVGPFIARDRVLLSWDIFKFVPFKKSIPCNIIVSGITSEATFYPKFRLANHLTDEIKDYLEKLVEKNKEEWFKNNKNEIDEWTDEKIKKEWNKFKKNITFKLKINGFKPNIDHFTPKWNQINIKAKSQNIVLNSDSSKSKYIIVPVGANWTDNTNIIGYYNSITEEYQSTPAYDLIKQANIHPNNPYFLILDEMNLSHVERYFADFLSAIESDEEIPLYGNNEKLKLPKNLFILGTVNVDETTYMFSPKVLDRTNTIEFETISVNDYIYSNLENDDFNGDISYLQSPLVDSDISNLNISDLIDILSEISCPDGNLLEVLTVELDSFQQCLKASGFEFGFRVINEILRFMVVAWRYENSPENWDNWERYFDAQIKQKILPKLHGSQKAIGSTLNDLFNLCLIDFDSNEQAKLFDIEEDNCKYYTSALKLQNMSKVLSDQRYVSFIN